MDHRGPVAPQRAASARGLSPPSAVNRADGAPVAGNGHVGADDLLSPIPRSRALVPIPAVTADVWPHPITAEGHETRWVPVAPGTTVAQLLHAELRAADPDSVVLVDGQFLDREDWHRTPLRDGAIVTVRAAAADGDFFRSVLQIAVIAASVFVPGALGLSGLAAAGVSAGISIAGGLIVNAIAPIRPPDLSAGGAGGAVQADPVFSLVGGTNRARLYEPLPLLLGQHRVFPDLAAKEYVEFEGDDQYLFGIYHFGYGDLDLDHLHIGPTPAGTLSDLQTERGNALGQVTLVAGNVDTEAGAVLTDTNAVARNTGADTDRIAVDLSARLFQINEDTGDYEAHSVTVQIQWEKPGTAAQARNVTLTNDSQTLLRRTVNIDLGSKGTWTVRVLRTTAPDDDNDYIHDAVEFAALRSYQADEGNYTGQNRFAVKVRASGQLSGRLNRLSAMAWQKIPVPAGSVWGSANVRTSNPAAIFRWFAKGIFVGNRLVAGCNLGSARRDDAGLAEWYAWCEAKGLRCDLWITGGMSKQQVLELIAQCGRASVSWNTGKLGAVYDDENEPTAGMITPGNIIKDSFQVDYARGSVADEVVVRYIEPAMDWQYNSVRRKRPGLAGPPAVSTTVTARGVTHRDNAAVECNLQVARQHYHKRRLKWEMGREGRSYIKGSVHWISHGLIDGGIVGRVREWAGNELRLDRPVAVAAGWILLRMPDGALERSEVAAVGAVGGKADRFRLTSASPPAAPGSRDGELLDVLWRLYDAADPPKKVRVIAFEPVSDRRYRITAIDEVSAYYALATSDLSAPFPDANDRTPRVVAVTFSAERIRVGTADQVRLQAAITTSGAWHGGVVRAGDTQGRLRKVDVLEPGESVAVWDIPPETSQYVEIVPGTFAEPTGPVWSGFWPWDGQYPVKAPTNFAVTVAEDGTRCYAFTLPDDPRVIGAKIRYHEDADEDFDDMVVLHSGIVTSSPYESLDPLKGAWEFAIVAVTASGNESAPTRITATLGPGRARGNTWHFGTTDPAAALGEDSDFYLNTNTRELWQKVSGAWVKQATLTHADGAQWHHGDAAPTADLGADGDWYFQTGNADVAGTIWTKSAGAWAKEVDIDEGTRGAVWHGGSGVPGEDLGEVGDWYFRSDQGYVYQKTDATTWTFRRDITGPQGIGGATWHTGAGAPGNTLGNDGDLYFRTGNQTVYRKASGSWSQIADLSAADGARWFTGSGAPANTLGANGDWYFRTGTGALAGQIYTKSAGAWVKQVDIDQGTEGAHWLSGTGAPGSSLGVVGDWYFRTSNGYVYEKTGTSTWTFRRDITGPVGPQGPGPTAAQIRNALPSGIYDNLSLNLRNSYTRRYATRDQSLDGTTDTRRAVYDISSGATAADGTRTLNVLYDAISITYNYVAPSPTRPSPGQ